MILSMTTFEAYVLDVKEATYTVKNAANGAIYHNCKLCAMGVSDWCVSKDDYVLCTNTEHGRTYILGEIKGRAASTEGIRLGESDTDKFVVTQQATLIHQRDINTTIIDADGLEGFYKKVTIKGFGTAIECTEDSIVISVPGKISGTGKVTITPASVKIDANTLIELDGADGGYILRGNETAEMLDEIKSILTGFITKYNAHQHVVTGGGGGTASAIVPAMQQGSSPSKTYRKSTKVKSS